MRAWQWVAILWLILCLYPVEYRTSRIVEIAGAAVVWIEADPTEGKVIEVSMPTENPWLTEPVVFVRQECLAR